ncbi:hypothetical protein mRhiFer1_008716 [Rhinolophus ferrumequinum]|uniref:Uncharacterized protein n=1 Tax=Rhinolophus ferrumequinum TaxID=59479 RepID=A0A7J7TQF3_RHIFE|nr:hypothetical protein mRhiFer1_008716 [Rhinolophus ferrumequinum]
MSASPRPADACPFPDRALANVLLLRVVVIYILSVYINLSAAALAALLQSACLLGSLGDFPHRRPGGCRGNWAAKFLRPANNNKRLLRRSPAAWSRPGTQSAVRGLGVGGHEGTARAGQRQAARGWK